MKLTREDSDEHKARYKLVRRDDFVDIPGAIVEADEETGRCLMQKGEESRELDLGPGGFRIVGKER